MGDMGFFVLGMEVASGGSIGPAQEPVAEVREVLCHVRHRDAGGRLLCRGGVRGCRGLRDGTSAGFQLINTVSPSTSPGPKQ